MSIVKIQVPEDLIKDIEDELNGLRETGPVVKTIANNTAKKVQRLLVQKASKEYTGEVARKKNILNASTIKKATTGNVTATIRFISPVHEIKEFHVSSLEVDKPYYRKDGKRGGKKTKGKVLSGSQKALKDAFVVRFKSGHISVVKREQGTHMNSNPKKEKLRKLLSPSYKTMIGGERVYGKSSNEIGVIMHNEAEKVLDRIFDRIIGGK